jgi:hypothetical protein
MKKFKRLIMDLTSWTLIIIAAIPVYIVIGVWMLSFKIKRWIK